MANTDPPSSPCSDRVLDYAAPGVGRRHRVKHVVAIVFSAVALIWGSLFAFGAINWYLHSKTDPTTIDRRESLHNAILLLIFSIALLATAIWYGRIGLRGESKRV